MLAPLRPVLRGAAAWEGWWVVALLLCAGATSAQQQQQQDVDEHASRYCADSPRWSIAGGGANCSVAARLIQSYLRSASRPKCRTISACCRHFSAAPYRDSPFVAHGGSTIRAVAFDGTSLQAACPASCFMCGAAQPRDDHVNTTRLAPSAPPVPLGPATVVAAVEVPGWDTARERHGCNDYSDTDCAACSSTSHRSKWFGAPCIWDSGAPPGSRCDSCFFCSAVEVRSRCAAAGNTSGPAYDWLFHRHLNTTGSHAIWYKTGACNAPPHNIY
jgi:hypothetical protein